MRDFETHPEKLRHIFEGLQEIISKYKPADMAVEAPFHGKNIQSMLKLGRAQGVAMAVGMIHDLKVIEYSPKKIKVAISGNGNASKEQVCAMLESILNVSLEKVPLDASDALAAALCHHFQGDSIIGGKKRYKDWNSYLKENPGRLSKK